MIKVNLKMIIISAIIFLLLVFFPYYFMLQSNKKLSIALEKERKRNEEYIKYFLDLTNRFEVENLKFKKLFIENANLRHQLKIILNSESKRVNKKTKKKYDFVKIENLYGVGGE